MKFYKGNITRTPNTIFVFGSNTQGRHGAGAAKIAHDVFGAIYGQPYGRQGNSYAIVTKNLKDGYRSIKKEEIIEQIVSLYRYAEDHPELNFKVAYRNLEDKSLNGYTGLEMIDMFIKAAGEGEIPDNVWFSEEWLNSGKFSKILF